MQLKVTASEIFKDQKDSYPQSVGRLFLDSRLGMCWYMLLVRWCWLMNWKFSINKSVSVVLARTWADQPEGSSDPRKWQSAGRIHFILSELTCSKILLDLYLVLCSMAFRLLSTTGGVSNLGLVSCFSPTPLPCWWTGPKSSRGLTTLH